MPGGAPHPYLLEEPGALGDRRQVTRAKAGATGQVREIASKAIVVAYSSVVVPKLPAPDSDDVRFSGTIPACLTCRAWRTRSEGTGVSLRAQLNDVFGRSLRQH